MRCVVVMCDITDLPSHYSPFLEDDTCMSIEMLESSQLRVELLRSS